MAGRTESPCLGWQVTLELHPRSPASRQSPPGPEQDGPQRHKSELDTGGQGCPLRALGPSPIPTARAEQAPDGQVGTGPGTPTPCSGLQGPAVSSTPPSTLVTLGRGSLVPFPTGRRGMAMAFSLPALPSSSGALGS